MSSLALDRGACVNNTMSLLRDLMKLSAPVKYTDILSHFDQSGFVTVTGDEDNTFKP